MGGGGLENNLQQYGGVDTTVKVKACGREGRWEVCVCVWGGGGGGVRQRESVCVCVCVCVCVGGGDRERYCVCVCGGGGGGRSLEICSSLLECKLVNLLTATACTISGLKDARRRL